MTDMVNWMDWYVLGNWLISDIYMTKRVKTLATSSASTSPLHLLFPAKVQLSWRQRKTRKTRRKRRPPCLPWVVFPSVLLVAVFAPEYHRRRRIHCCLSQVQYCLCYLSVEKIKQRRWISTKVWYIDKVLACRLTNRCIHLSSTLGIWGLSFIRAQGSSAL